MPTKKPRRIVIKREKGSELKPKSKSKQIEERLRGKKKKGKKGLA